MQGRIVDRTQLKYNNSEFLPEAEVAHQPRARNMLTFENA
jgi:hypothetical protein